MVLELTSPRWHFSYEFFDVCYGLGSHDADLLWFVASWTSWRFGKGVLHSQSVTPESSGRSIHPLPPQSLQLRRRSAAAARRAFSNAALPDTHRSDSSRQRWHLRHARGVPFG
ncbi:hypothetical protein P5V38_26655 [Mycobacteroides abscessus subsp. abscessus]|uniref:hypothetical protein n=1 Tax=Mycobacteroides abscessus TaxID=36809 RepID=UPI00266CDB72|nr:hypothetical protein [Mycobacteroides abscessus]MDO3086311.1 hypothetical protein [Mycobacteroides abscessus subsp. abscessus]